MLFTYSLTLALLAIIVIVSLYYNLHRYALLHLDYSDTDCIQNYMSLKRVNYDHKVIVSLTTTPQRIHKLKPMIKSILNQTVRIDQIVLNIPNSKNFKVPKELESMIHVYSCGRDYGSGTKCIPTILRENDSDTLIIMLDDRFIYGETFIEDLVEKVKKDSDACLYCKGTIVAKSGFFKEDIVDVTREAVDDKLLMRYINAPKKKVDMTTSIYPSNFVW